MSHNAAQELKRTTVEGIYKDPSTGALINKNVEKLESYRRQKALFRDVSKNKSDIFELCQEVRNLRNMIQELRRLIEEPSLKDKE
jgi:hypothetical protein